MPFACEVLSPSEALGDVDVEVIEGTVPRHLPERSAFEAGWDAAPGLFLVRGGRRAARFLVKGGGVIFERNAACDVAVLARCFTSRVLPAILRQHGFLVLHANAVEMDHGVVVIGGESGAGKSTTLAALIGQGCTMLSDDVTALRFGTSSGTVEVVPGVAQTHLAEDAVENLGYVVDRLQFQPWRRMKTAIPTHASMAYGPLPVKAIWILSHHAVSEVVVTGVSGAERFRLLQEALYGPVLAEEHTSLLSLMTKVVQTIPCYRLVRPDARWSVDEVVEAIGAGGLAAVSTNPDG
jgi:hypothetical protein